MRKIPYARQWIDEEDIKSVVDVLKGDWITQGPKIDELENSIAKYVGTQYAVAFNSGTAALHAAMFAAGVKKDDSIITSPISFVASSNSAIYLGAKPEFVDIDINTYCLNIEKLKRIISKKTKIILPVDYAGYPIDIQHLREITDNYNITIIEDAAHALGAKRYGKLVGQEADMTMFSFHPAKHITTGEGGIIVTNDKNHYEKLIIFRTHGITKKKDFLENLTEGPWYYEMHYLGYNYRITDFQCALGLSQFHKLNYFLTRRNEIARIYNEAFQDFSEVSIPPIPPYSNSAHAYHIYPLLVPKRKRLELYTKLKEHDILCQVHYIPIHLQPYYRKNYEFRKGDYPIAEKFYERELTIPLFPRMTNSDVDYVINIISKFVN